MYTIANKHNKKTRKLSSSSRNKHKSKSKNKRKHKYTIGKTRKYTKSHNTIHIGGVVEEEERLKATQQRIARERQESLRRLNEESMKDDQQEEEDARQEGEEVLKAAAARSNPDVKSVRKLPPAKPSPQAKGTKTTPIESESPRLDSAAEAQRVKTEAEAKRKAEAERLKAEAKKKAEEDKLKAEAKKKEREAKREAASQKTYDKFIDTINQYDFKTETPNETPDEAPYIKFSKFIQKIMDLQFKMKDDGIRKKAQTITDQILTAYSALISYKCSTTFLREHFETYMKKLNIQDSVTITDPKSPSLNIVGVDESIKTKLQNLASKQNCKPTTSQHLVKEPVTNSELPLISQTPEATQSNPYSFHSYHLEEEEEEEDDEGEGDEIISGFPRNRLPAVPRSRSLVPPHPTRSS